MSPSLHPIASRPPSPSSSPGNDQAPIGPSMALADMDQLATRIVGWCDAFQAGAAPSLAELDDALARVREQPALPGRLGSALRMVACPVADATDREISSALDVLRSRRPN